MSFTSDVANATVRDEIVDGKQNVNNGGGYDRQCRSLRRQCNREQWRNCC